MIYSGSAVFISFVPEQKNMIETTPPSLLFDIYRFDVLLFVYVLRIVMKSIAGRVRTENNKRPFRISSSNQLAFGWSLLNNSFGFAELRSNQPSDESLSATALARADGNFIFLLWYWLYSNDAATYACARGIAVGVWNRFVSYGFQQRLNAINHDYNHQRTSIPQTFAAINST